MTINYNPKTARTVAGVAVVTVLMAILFQSADRRVVNEALHAAPNAIAKERERDAAWEREKAELDAKLRQVRSESRRSARATLSAENVAEILCKDGRHYFKNIGGFMVGEHWMLTGPRIVAALVTFDEDNAIYNRILMLQAMGWKDKIPAGVVMSPQCAAMGY